MIIKYIRRVKNEISPQKKVPMKRVQKVGVLIAFRDAEDYIRIGWSALNTQSQDKFNPEVGIELAKKNTTCILNEETMAKLPVKIRKAMPHFIQRAENYFKDSVIR